MDQHSTLTTLTIRGNYCAVSHNPLPGRLVFSRYVFYKEMEETTPKYDTFRTYLIIANKMIDFLMKEYRIYFLYRK